MLRRSDLDAFYDLLADLEGRIGGRRRLGDCCGRTQWPERGVYFFFEDGQQRACDKALSRVVRVGSDASC